MFISCEIDPELAILLQQKMCDGARNWLQTQKTYNQAWKNCSRGDWMLWLIRQSFNVTELQKLRRFIGVKLLCVKKIIPFILHRKDLLDLLAEGKKFVEGKLSRQKMELVILRAYSLANSSLDTPVSKLDRDAEYAVFYALSFYSPGTGCLFSAIKIVKEEKTPLKKAMLRILANDANLIRSLYSGPPDLPFYLKLNNRKISFFLS